MPIFTSIVDVVQNHAHHHPNDIAFKFLSEQKEEELSYYELDKRAKRVAYQFQQNGIEKDERAVILLPPGLDYIISFFACLYAGVIAVPVYPLRNNHHKKRVLSILEDAQAKCIITNQHLSDDFNPYYIFEINEINYSSNLESCFTSSISSNKTALLQYTSGSTSAPKGVQISHGNIMANLKALKIILGETDKDTFCSWLPPYHDMGLIAFILMPIYVKRTCYLMPPPYFFHSPVRWLKLISEKNITLTAAPNFALELCAYHIADEMIQGLNLSRLRCLFNGGEPIQYKSLQRFINRFSSIGFSSKALRPAYGLAEVTLMLTTHLFDTSQNFIDLEKNNFEQGKVFISNDNKTSNIRVVNCGQPQTDHHIRIVEPQSGKPLPENYIGEIWGSGSSIAQGYWNQPKLNENIFNNQLDDEPGINYLRTGDLGFIHQGELYVTGRMKELIIIHGLNYYPQDIEEAFSSSNPAFEFRGTIAFSVEFEGIEKLVILQELTRHAFRKTDTAPLFEIIRANLLNQFGLVPHSIIFVKPHSLPKTSSGKIQRLLAKKQYLEHTLSEVKRWTSDKVSSAEIDSASIESKTWIKDWLERHVNLSLRKEDYEKTIIELGINSLTTMELSKALHDHFGLAINASQFETLSLQELINFLSNSKLTVESSIVLRTLEPKVKSRKVEGTRCQAKQPNHKSSLISNLKTIYYNVNDGISKNTTHINGEGYINFSGYNYLGLSDHPRVIQSVIDAVKEFGTSVSASRIVSGEKPLHRQLEQAIANLIGVDDSLVFPSGYLTNISILTHLFSKGDLIIHDALAHNSLIQGAAFSGSERIAFPHNEIKFINSFLEKYRERYKKVLIVTEGVFSMDGDIAKIPELIDVKKQFDAKLMVDEAHSMGVIGKTGRGIREFFNLNPLDIDIWMGTLSKSFASCGGYIAGSHDLIEDLKYSSAGFIYSAGISPANTAAALAAIQIMNEEIFRVKELHNNHRLLLQLLSELPYFTGQSINSPIIPIITGDDELAVKLSLFLKQNNILALPIIYPAVERNLARVRLFVNCLHTKAQLYTLIDTLKEYSLLSLEANT